MNNEWFNEIIGQVQEEMERLKELSTACEKQEVYYKTMISTHEVTIGQQAIYIGEFEKAKIDSETKAHNSLRNKEEAELNAIVDEQVLEIKNLQMDVKKLHDEQVVLDVNTSAKRMDTCPCCNSDVDIYGEALQDVLMDSCTHCPCQECGGIDE